MQYVTLLQLAESPGALELAQVASASHAAVVDAQLMELTLRAGDRSSYTSDEIAAADDAKARIEQLIADAGGIIDGYLARRYTLPLTQLPGILVTWGRAIVRYKLNKDRQSQEGSDPVVRDYRDAIKFLQQVADGKFSLGLEDPAAGSSVATDVQINPGSKVFGRSVLP